MKTIGLTISGKKYEGTFAHSDDYKCLKYVYNNLDGLSKNHRSYVLKLMTYVNSSCVKVKDISDVGFRKFVKELMRDHYKVKMGYLHEIIEDKALVSHVANYVSTKFKQLK